MSDFNKIIQDNIYGFIPINSDILKIIDSYEFQRLRFIKQLGLTHFVFPGAQHTRFEHSIGVFHLINIFLEKLQKKSVINPRLCKIISVAGLIHDLGHVSFSHMFDDAFCKEGFKHENRSIQLFTIMNKKYDLGYSDKEIKLIENIILGEINPNYPKFVFQIVANKQNELDLDKIDYLMRDAYYLGKHVTFDYKYLFENTKIINQEICFNVKTSFTILSLFNMRYELHKKFYNHKTVIIYETMAYDAIMNAFNSTDIEKLFKSDQWLFKLTDNLLYDLLNYPKSRDIVLKILSRNLYKLSNEKTPETYTIIKHIGLTGKRQNPILNINFYDKEKNIIKLNMNEISIFNLIHSYEIKEFNILRT